MPRILVIDDDDEMRLMLRMMLEKEGYDVSDTFDGDVGVRLFNQDPFDLVITDILMPRKEGIATIVELRRDNPDLKVIAISGGSMQPNTGLSCGNVLKLAQAVGASCVLAKPFDRDEFLGAVQKLLP